MAAEPAPPMSVRGAWNALRWPTGRDLLYSAKAFAAVALSLTVGFSQNLENPYWSGLTIYTVMSQPQTGAIRSKALFRLAGTVIGGTGAIVLASLFGSHIGVELIATIAAMLVSYYFKTLDRTPASYTWFATSLTLAVIGIVHVQQPQTIFAFAATRMGEISLGIVAIGVVDSILFPTSAMPDFLGGMRDWRNGAADWAAAALAPDASLDPQARWDRRRGFRKLAALLGPLDAQGVQLPYDTTPVPPRGADLRLVRQTVAHLLASLAAANIWIEAARGGGVDEEELAAELRGWIADKPEFGQPEALLHAARGEAIADRLRASFLDAAAPATRPAVLDAAVRLRLAELARHWATLERVLHAIAGGTGLAPALRARARAARPARSIDYLVGVFDVAPLLLALGTGAAIWYFTAWTAGINAMLFAFVVCGFIIGTPGAVRSAVGASLWTFGAFAVTFFYLFVALPRVTAFPVLLGVLGAGLLPLGILTSMTPAGLLMTANAFAFLGLQNAYAADFATTLQSLAGSMAGCLLAVTALYLCRFDRARLRARRLARALDRDVVDAARSRRIPDRDRLLSLSVDRIALFFGIVDGLPADDPLQRHDLVARLRVLANLAELRRQERHLAPAVHPAVRALRSALAHTFDHRPLDRPALLATVGSAFDALLDQPADAYRARALAALTGLRIALTPDPAFEAMMGGDGA